MITLTLKEKLAIPVEADCITPDNLRDKSNEEIKALKVYWGNKKLAIGDFFDVDGEKSEAITIIGDCDKVKLIGKEMSLGEIHIEGNAGYNTGSYMTGGQMIIDGNTRDYLGGMMEGGRIIVNGNAGNFLGGAYKGETVGMKGGEIFVKGNAGHETGGFMRRGLIVVGGNAGDFTGFFMHAGTVVVLGRAGDRVGANMTRGSVVLMNETVMLPSFYENSTLQSPAINMVLKHAASFGFNTPDRPKFIRFNGDVNHVGKGEILVLAQ